MVEIHVYGKLRRYATNGQSARASVIALEPDTRETLTSLLARAGIPVEEINHIFFNGNLLVSRAKAASFMGFTQTGSDVSGWDLNVPVDNGDRIGLFGRDMALLGM
jgi:hypothetical protein